MHNPLERKSIALSLHLDPNVYEEGEFRVLRENLGEIVARNRWGLPNPSQIIYKGLLCVTAFSPVKLVAANNISLDVKHLTSNIQHVFLETINSVFSLHQL